MQNVINWIGFLAFGIVVVLIMIKAKSDEEEYYPLKMFGYYFLGAFQFIFNGAHIPLGFVIFILFLRSPNKNAKAKRYAACVGVLALATALIIPSITDMYYQRERIIKSDTNNIYELDFNNHIQRVKEVLDIDEQFYRYFKLENLKVGYEKSGEIIRLNYEVVWKEESELRYLRAIYDPKNRVFKVKPKKIEQWLQYDRMIIADRMFDILDGIDLREVVPKEGYSSYGLTYRWSPGSFGAFKERVYIIDGYKIIPFASEKPVNCSWFVTYGMASSSEGSSSSDYSQYYLFDVINK